MTELTIPDMSLVLLVGVSGSGKSTFAREHFAPFESLSSDFFRGLVSNDPTDQAATAAAFDALRFVAGKRLEAGLLTVIDATNVQPAARKDLVALAREHDVLPVAIVLDLPESVCVARNTSRTDRLFGSHVIRRQHDQLRRSLRFLTKEGFRRIHVLRAESEIAEATIVREPLLTDRRTETGPFDAIGDVHGCRSELETLLDSLGYVIGRDDRGRAIDAAHPAGRRVIFLGDLVDRGPDVPGVLRLAMGMVEAGHALAVPGNHEAKLLKALQGRKVQFGHGLAESMAALAAEPPEFRARVERFCYDLVSHLVLDEGRLVVAHAGLKQSYQGRASGRVRAFALYGETTGETDEFGLPVRYPWAQEYRGPAVVLYGHTPVPEVEWINNTACVDTGCVFGGALSAMRYPEREVVSVAAEQVWYAPAKPLVPAAPPERAAGLLRIDDVLGKSVVETALHGRVTVRAEQAAGALEVMSRYAIDPGRLLYLPPTMSPCDAAPRSSGTAASIPDGLEHPSAAFEYFRGVGVNELSCQEKHMGSRAVVLVSREPGRFAAPAGWRGVVHTRTGRPFFAPDLESRFLERVSAAVDRTGLWADLQTDWLLLDCELLPWSLKADELIRDLYASVGAAARVALPAATTALRMAAGRGIDVREVLERSESRMQNADNYVTAYRRYVAPTSGLDGVALAPFQLLAAEAATFETRDQGWHLAIADRLVATDPALFRSTRRLRVDLADPKSVAAGINWWQTLTDAGGEGAVIKPFANLVRNEKGLVQPGIKVRGREYLRIIYGPDYTEPANLDRLRDRNLGLKRSLALREYALGLEALHRFVNREPLWRVHQAVFAVLALESDPVDPRL